MNKYVDTDKVLRPRVKNLEDSVCINGVSRKFAKSNPNWKEMNKTNQGCWNCSNCNYCNSCDFCNDCNNCNYCNSCNNCNNCNNLNSCNG